MSDVFFDNIFTDMAFHSDSLFIMLLTSLMTFIFQTRSQPQQPTLTALITVYVVETNCLSDLDYKQLVVIS